MSQYLILIYEAEAEYATASPELMGEIVQAHGVFARASRGTARNCSAVRGFTRR